MPRCPVEAGVYGTQENRAMADEVQTIRSINWREVFPFTNLFKAFRVAVHPSKLVLALAALLLIYTGGRILDGIWAKDHLVKPGFGPATMMDDGDRLRSLMRRYATRS